MPRRTKEEAAQTRRRILEAALDVFTEKGYSKTRFVDIAERIGLSKGAIYWHFKTKVDLLTAVIRHAEETYFDEVIGRRPDTLAELRKIVLGFARKMTEDKQLQKIEFFHHFQIEWSAELMTDVHKRLEALRGDPSEDFEQSLIHLQETGDLSPEVDVGKLALALVATWIGAMELALMKECAFEQFYEVMEFSFDTILGPHATRPKT